MCPTTGLISTFPAGQVPPGFIPLDKEPESKCPKCKGRGHNGQLVKTDNGLQYRPCSCTKH